MRLYLIVNGFDNVPLPEEYSTVLFMYALGNAI